MSGKPIYEDLEQRLLLAKQAQMLLEDARNLHKLFDWAPYGLFIIDLTGTIVFATEVSAMRLGKTAKQIIGTSLMDYFPPDIAEKRMLKGIEVVNSGDPQKIEDQIDGRWYFSKICPIKNNKGKIILLAIFSDDITERKRSELEKEKLISELENALKKIKQLSGLLPICSHCKKVRDDKGYWNKIESFIQERSNAEFTHSLCAECAKKIYPNLIIADD